MIFRKELDKRPARYTLARDDTAKSEIFGVAECEIIHFVNCEISHAAFGSVRCEMKFAHVRVSEYFTFAKQIFHSEAISLARRANFVEKSTCLCKCFFHA